MQPIAPALVRLGAPLLQAVLLVAAMFQLKHPPPVEVGRDTSYFVANGISYSRCQLPLQNAFCLDDSQDARTVNVNDYCLS